MWIHDGTEFDFFFQDKVRKDTLDFFSILFNSRIFCKQVFLDISSFVEFLCVFGSIAFSPTGHKEGGLIIVHLAFGLGGGRHA